MIHTRARDRCFSNAEIPPRVSTKPRRRSQQKNRRRRKGGTFSHPSPQSHPPRSPSELTPRARATEDTDEKKKRTQSSLLRLALARIARAFTSRTSATLVPARIARQRVRARAPTRGARTRVAALIARHEEKKLETCRSFVRSLASGPARACDAARGRGRSLERGGGHPVGCSLDFLMGFVVRLYEKWFLIWANSSSPRRALKSTATSRDRSIARAASTESDARASVDDEARA